MNGMEQLSNQLINEIREFNEIVSNLHECEKKIRTENFFP